MKYGFIVLLSVGALLILTGSQMAASSDPALVIDLINQVRAEYGLSAYTSDPTLMAVAQAHSEYMAATGLITHTGPGNSTPKERVNAAGYGSSGTYIHENIYAGWQADAYDAVVWWRNSPVHFEGMTLSQAQRIGVGVTVGADGLTYFTAIFAAAAGDSPAPPPAPATPIPAVAVSAADTAGAVIHVVQVGQTVSLIAAYYGVSPSQVLELNGLGPDTIIHAGDQLIISLAPTPTPMPPTASPTPADVPATPLPAQPTATLAESLPSPAPAPTSTPAPVVDPAAQDAASPAGGSAGAAAPGSGVWSWLLPVIAAGAVALVVGLFIGRLTAGGGG